MAPISLSRIGVGVDQRSITKQSGAAPPGYGFVHIGTPPSNQIIRVGSDSSAPRIAIPTGA